MRQALLAGASFCAALAGSTRPADFRRGLVAAFEFVFAWALRRTKITGTLTHM